MMETTNQKPLTLPLYEIGNHYQEVFRHINSIDSDITENDLDLLNQIGDKFEDKAISVAAFIKNMQAERMGVSDAIASMQKRKEKLDNKIDWMMDYLRFNLEKCQIDQINKCPLFTIRLKNNPPSIKVLDSEIIPDNYKKMKVDYTMDKQKMKEDIQSGKEIPGVELIQEKRVDIR